MAGKDLEQLQEAIAALEAKMDKLCKLVQKTCENSKSKKEPVIPRVSDLEVEPVYIDVFSMPDTKP